MCDLFELECVYFGDFKYQLCFPEIGYCIFNYKENITGSSSEVTCIKIFHHPINNQGLEPSQFSTIFCDFSFFLDD